MKFFIYLLAVLLTITACKENSEKNDILTESKPKAEVKAQAIITFAIGNIVSGEKKLKTGDIVEEGSTIAAMNKSTAEVQFVNMESNTSARIHQNSELIFKKNSASGKKEEKFQIKKGEVVFNVQKTKQDENVIILTPSIVAGVRGTKFVVIVPADKSSTIEVIDGNVAIAPFSPDLNKLSQVLVEKNDVLQKAENAMSITEIILGAGEKGRLAKGDVDNYLESAGVAKVLKSKEVAVLLAKDNPTEAEIASAQTIINSSFQDVAVVTKSNQAFEKKINLKSEKINDSEIKKRIKEYEEMLVVEKQKLEKASDKKVFMHDYSSLHKKEIIQKIEKILGKDSQILVIKDGTKIEGVIDSNETGDITVYTIDGKKTFKRNEVDSME